MARNKEDSDTMSAAEHTAHFFNDLIRSGLTRDEALRLTLAYQSHTFAIMAGVKKWEFQS
jgi:hypothetical protein